ncbi:CAP domain-containing protein [Plectonema cf. radiosum LEGE 06105]|uniref:CAP domain-containing protein n=2 Tax=Plectonema TaxID=1183 RepID=A0A8J7FFC2_9CYAN|nr:CAP domain-containing protein [Plectonema cf. radiosum LEGE 06105]
MKTKKKTGAWWKYVLLFTLLLTFRPVTYFIRQAQNGYPVDPNYFWTEFSPFGLFQHCYNGNGGKDWKIGECKVTVLNADKLRSLPELSKFALKVVNRDRNINNLSLLQEDSLLSQTAQLHAQDMLLRGYFSHYSPEGKTPRQRYLAAGGNSRLGVGENIAKGTVKGLALTYGQTEKWQRGWMYSDGHRANILTSQYKKFGYGIAAGADGRIYAVQMFAD